MRFKKLLSDVGHLFVHRGESAELRSRLLSGGGGLILLRIAFSALSFGLTVLLARVLGREGFGTYSYAFAWIVLLCIPAILGTDQLLVREVSAYAEGGEWGLLHGLLRTVNGAVLAASLVMAGLAGAFAWFWKSHFSAQVFATLMAGLVLIPLISLTRVRQSAMQGLHKVAAGSVPEQLISPLLQLGAFFAVVLLNPGRFSAPVAMLINAGAAAVAFSVGAFTLYRTMPKAVSSAIPVYRKSEWSRSALRMLFLTGAGVLFMQADTLILGALKGTAEVGTYSVAHRGADLLIFFLTAQSSTIASTAAALHSSGERQQLQRVVTRITRGTFLSTLPLALAMMLGGHWFLALYGKQYLPAQVSLSILSLGQLINVAFGSVGILLTMTGNEHSAAVNIGFAAALNIALSFALIPHWGAEGAASAYAISMVVWNLCMAVSLWRKVSINGTILGSR